jgi:hypothetical protein
MRALVCGALLALSGCGGTSSETPWPVEPDDLTPGPSGESPAAEPKPAAVAEEPDGGEAPRQKKAAEPEQ